MYPCLMAGDFSLNTDPMPSVLARGQQTSYCVWRHSDYKANGGCSNRLDHQGSENWKGKTMVGGRNMAVNMTALNVCSKINFYNYSFQ